MYKYCHKSINRILFFILMPPKKSKKAPSPSPDVAPKKSSRVKDKDDKVEDKKKYLDISN